MKFIRIGRSYINVDSITAVRNTEGEYTSHRTEVYTTKGEYHTNEFTTNILSQIENPLEIDVVKKQEEEYFISRYSAYDWKINKTGEYQQKNGNIINIIAINYEYKKAYSNLREGFDLILEYNAETGEYLNYNNKDYNIE